MATEHILVPRQKYEQLTMSANSNNVLRDQHTSKQQAPEHDDTEKKHQDNLQHNYDPGNDDDDYASATDSDDSDNSYLYNDGNTETNITENTEQGNNGDKKEKESYASAAFQKKRTREDVLPRPPGIMKKDIDIAIAKRYKNLNKTKPKHKNINVKRWIKW